MSALRRHFSGRIDPFTSAILVFPLFITYQVGILAGARGRNGADFVTDALIRLCDRDLGTYLLLLAAMIVGYGVTLRWLRRKRRFTPGAFVPMLLEASVYGLFMGALIQLVVARFFELIPVLALGPWSAGEVLVISAGAGLHEELIFRAVLMAGLARLFALPLLPFGRAGGWVAALVASSVIFSLAHHLGPAGEVFSSAAFIYRSLAGALFGLLYWLRGFAVAAWTHALYDVFVLTAAG